MSDSLLSLADVKLSLGLSGGGGGGVTSLVAGSNIILTPSSGVGTVTVSSSGGGFSGYNSSSGAIIVPYDDTSSGATVTVPLATIPANLVSGNVYYVKVWTNIALKISKSNSLSTYTFTPQLSGCPANGSLYNANTNIVLGNSSTSLTNVWVAQTSQQYYSVLAQILQTFDPISLEGYYTATDTDIHIDTILTAGTGDASSCGWDGSSPDGTSTISFSAVWSLVSIYNPTPPEPPVVEPPVAPVEPPVEEPPV